jgi:hypothetical protein
MTVRGLVEFAGASHVSGWAYDSESPFRTPRNHGHGSATSSAHPDFAHIERHDLLLAGIGDGKHGFSIDLRGANLSAEDASALEAHAISGAEVIKLPRARATPEGYLSISHPAPLNRRAMTPSYRSLFWAPRAPEPARLLSRCWSRPAMSAPAKGTYCRWPMPSSR